jgi:hypothetical protein
MLHLYSELMLRFVLLPALLWCSQSTDMGFLLLIGEATHMPHVHVGCAGRFCGCAGVAGRVAAGCPIWLIHVFPGVMSTSCSLTVSVAAGWDLAADLAVCITSC